MGRCAHQYSPPKLPVGEAGRAEGEGAQKASLYGTEKRKFLLSKTKVNEVLQEHAVGLLGFFLNFLNSLDTFPFL